MNAADLTDHDLLVRIDERVHRLMTNGDGHETRIRSLEQWRWKILGAGGLLSVIFGGAGAFALRIVTGH